MIRLGHDGEMRDQLSPREQAVPWASRPTVLAALRNLSFVQRVRPSFHCMRLSGCTIACNFYPGDTQLAPFIRLATICRNSITTNSICTFARRPQEGHTRPLFHNSRRATISALGPQCLQYSAMMRNKSSNEPYRRRRTRSMR